MGGGCGVQGGGYRDVQGTRIPVQAGAHEHLVMEPGGGIVTVATAVGSDKVESRNAVGIVPGRHVYMLAVPDIGEFWR